MNNNLRTFLFILLAVFLVSGGLIFMSSKSKKTADNNGLTTEENGGVAGASTADKNAEDSNKDDAYKEKLAKYMTEKGMAMYGAYWCPHCQDQKKLFGDSFKYVDYVECDAQGPNANPDECTAKGVEGYPTWIYQGQKYSGYQSLSALAKIVGFNDSSTTASATDSTPAQ